MPPTAAASSRKRRRKDGRSKSRSPARKKDGRSRTKRKVDGNYKIKSRKKKVPAAVVADGRGDKWSAEGWQVYTQAGCGYCDVAIKTLLEKGEQVKKPLEFKLLNDNEKSQVESKLNGYRFFPRIFNPRGEFIGGLKELKTLLI